ncbi:YkgJ family cysteine cluster protein [Burkholderia ubonensis]|uniref:YkgJ family cysteine cluster protein n=1 Tax=Burkholderia ubonensis TaxID=101571 RepID=UPI00075B57D3|nr:YkgJ family cysteine cluster protein [Burkholderia ubonensis]KVD26632.1 hypothetical protein WI82_15390 [Burkholderia ubonensis]
MNDIDFACTACGKCCHDLRLMLTIDEAIAWLQRGGRVELLCDAIPWPVEPEPDNAFAAYKRARSTPALSGALPVRVTTVFTASYAGPCPNLRADMRCGIYDERPLVCRIYPAEINPFVELSPEGKACPPDAWRTTPLLRGGAIVDDDTRRNIERSRAANVAEAPLRAQVCAALGVATAAVANEGFVIHAPPADALLAVLNGVRAAPATVEADDTGTQWTLLSNRAATVDALASTGAAVGLAASAADDARAFRYLGFFADAAAA